MSEKRLEYGRLLDRRRRRQRCEANARHCCAAPGDGRAPRRDRSTRHRPRQSGARRAWSSESGDQLSAACAIRSPTRSPSDCASASAAWRSAEGPTSSSPCMCRRRGWSIIGAVHISQALAPMAQIRRLRHDHRRSAHGLCHAGPFSRRAGASPNGRTSRCRRSTSTATPRFVALTHDPEDRRSRR